MPEGSPTRVLLVPYRGGPVAANLSPLTRKRRTVWGDPARNEFVAELGEGFAVTPRKMLRINGVNAGEVKFPTRTRQRVVILAETAEHAWRVEKMLPKWPVLDAMPKSERVVSNVVETESELDEQPSGQIATLMHVARYGINCDILVRATAGTGKLHWDSIRGGSGKKGTKPILVVDVQDLGSVRERANAVIRHREYLEQELRPLKASKGALRDM